MVEKFKNPRHVLEVITYVLAIVLFLEQSNTVSWATKIMSLPLLKIVFATLILVLLSINFRKQRAIEDNLKNYGSGLKEMEQKLAQVLSERNGSLYVRELITASHLEGNVIVLMNLPIPNSVHLFIASMIYIPETSRGMVLKGHKIFLEDIPEEVHFAENIRTWVTERSVAVEYLRDLSTQEPKD